ncbi:MAG TPA: CehA/McbA family metallohydrolase [Bryobacteraceae bacterium]|nr:CehA/McbA family metallohydrolase [Bryobacteraceae bacterium]
MAGRKIARRPFLAALAQPFVLRSETAALELRVSARGRPAAARVYITGEDGRRFEIPGAIVYKRQVETHSVVDGRASVSLPPGRYTVRAEKGAEYRGVEKSVELSAGGTARVTLDVPLFGDMNKEGWYSGDLHTHRKPEEMPLLARAEELNVAPVITRHAGDGRPVRSPYPAANLGGGDAKHVVTLQNQEVERLRGGHGAVVLLNTPRPVEANPALLFPLELEFCREARAQGGFVDGEKPIWKNIPVNLAFGALDAIGVVNNHFHPRDVLLDAEKYGSMERADPVYRTVPGFAQWMLDLYYSFLNCGFRIPVSAGSASGVMSSWPGYERVYVHLSGPFNYERWFRDLKAGRSVATNGPLLRVFADGKPPGAEFPFQKARRVRLSIDAQAQGPLERTEVVFNGRVLRSLGGAPDGAVKTTMELTVESPGWLAVRCFEPAGATIRYAHSSPFYFPEGGKLPVRAPDAIRWADYIHGLAAGLTAADYPSPPDYEKAQATFKEAEEIYRRLAGQGAR